MPGFSRAIVISRAIVGELARCPVAEKFGLMEGMKEERIGKRGAGSEKEVSPKVRGNETGFRLPALEER